MNNRSRCISLLFFLSIISFSAIGQEPKKAEAVNMATAQYRVKDLSFNSENSDFGIFPFSANSFFFSSNRKNETSKNAQQTYNYNGLPFLDLYTIAKTDTIFSAPVSLPGNVETKFNEGPVFFDPISSTFFITRNQYDKKKSQQSRHGVNRLKIYQENIDGTAFKSFGEFQYNSTSYSVGHAALSSDGQRIYFSSDMPGGLGGVDLYVCAKDGENWSVPKNLGNVINTSGNEMFPFVSADNKLFFSSNGHSTLAGLDIYSADIAGGDFKNLRSLGAPFNSDQDDFAFYIFPDNRSGYFSSNRAGGKGDDDIYSFELSNPVIRGVVMDEKGENKIALAKIKILDDELNVTDITTDGTGAFTFEAKPKNDYTIVAEKQGFVRGTRSVATTLGKTEFLVTFNLAREQYGLEGTVLNKDNNAGISNAEVSLIDKATGKINTTNSDEKGSFHFDVKPNLEYILRVEKQKFVTASVPVSTAGMGIGVKKQNVLLEELVVGKSIKIDNVYYDQGKWDIRPDAKIELDKMVALMNENPSMEIELSAHTDSRGSDASNMALSDNRAKAVAAYIVSKGISSSRITGKGYGESKLLNKCGNGVKCSDADHQVNRRTEFKILKIQ